MADFSTYSVPVAVDQLFQPQAKQIDDMHICIDDYPMEQRPIKQHTGQQADCIVMVPRTTLEWLGTSAWKQSQKTYMIDYWFI